MNTCLTRALGIVLGFTADLVLADPGRWHPVAGFGRCALALESRLYPGPGARRSIRAAARRSIHFDARARGTVFTIVLVGGASAMAVTADRVAARSPVARVATTALTVWACHGGTSLLRVASRQGELLENDDLAASRALLPWLCGRDPASLDADGLARAVVESVAENTSDAAVATLFWATVAGPAGAVAHRAANTLDAMVGHRNARYTEFGWASARLDDVLGWPAARVGGLLTAAVAPVVGGRPREVLRAWRRDAPAHPSPNAGVVESACAGALDVTLGGPTAYPYGVELRPMLGRGPTPGPADVRRAVLLMRGVQVATAALAVMTLLTISLTATPAGQPPDLYPRSRSARL